MIRSIMAGIRLPFRTAFVVALCMFIAACSWSSSGPPNNQGDICSMLRQRSDWGDALTDAKQKWGAPPHIVMAIIWKESSFIADARPPKKYMFFGLIPDGRVSSAYGYSQALDGTWEWYQDETGNSWSDRDDFDDATDFVGWYMTKTRKTNGLSMTDAYSHYLAYHEGHTGFKRGTWKSKGWLKRAAGRVAKQAENYRGQLGGCSDLL